MNLFKAGLPSGGDVSDNRQETNSAKKRSTVSPRQPWKAEIRYMGETTMLTQKVRGGVSLPRPKTLPDATADPAGASEQQNGPRKARPSTRGLACLTHPTPRSTAKPADAMIAADAPIINRVSKNQACETKAPGTMPRTAHEDRPTTNPNTAHTDPHTSFVGGLANPNISRKGVSVKPFIGKNGHCLHNENKNAPRRPYGRFTRAPASTTSLDPLLFPLLQTAKTATLLRADHFVCR